MPIQRPTVTDPGDRWAVAIGADPDAKLVGTRDDVLTTITELARHRVPHVIYRRPNRAAPWRLVAEAGPQFTPRSVSAS